MEERYNNPNQIPVQEIQGAGIRITGAAATANIVDSNFIGVGNDGLTDLGNNGPGVRMEAGASQNRIGGITAFEGNRIAFNDGDGISVVGATTLNNLLLSNLIWSNSGLGIDLGDDAYGQ